MATLENRKEHHDPSGHYPQPHGPGMNGRTLCRWCHCEVPSRRRCWCSDECLELYRLETDWNFIRSHVLQRDGGVCARCGCDVNKLKQRLFQAAGRFQATKILRRMGFNSGMELFQVDHIQPRILGGTNSLDNLRTLCVPCHKRVTAKLANNRSQNRNGNSRKS